MSIKRKAMTLGIVLAALGASAAGAYAATAYATSAVNVRSGPGTGYRVVDVLRRGEPVEIDYCRGSWCAISKAGPDGWVSANYLARGGRYDDDFYDDDFYDDDFYIVERPRRIIRTYPIYRDYDPAFSACVGGPNARFCIYD